MHRLPLLTLVVYALYVVTRPQSATATVDCDRDEVVALHDAPLGASRASKNRLSVKWSRGVATFRDSGVVDGYLDGIGYEYCGYVSAVGFHLIHKRDNGVFTGVLLNHATGKIIAAGKYVAFAPDRSRYFASARPDGLDGEEWYLYSHAGVRLWKGLSGITAKHPTLKYDYFVATLEQPRWSASGELQALLKCANGDLPPTVVSLAHQNAKWSWQPMVACAPAR